ncbi:DNA repair protein [Burkholderia sp. WAC0059]|uniref:DNA-3-methyladenine glycosylase family protein n=1 Tax=Burkholderia sp. WAC0059 TaxID=2066022 RepID=UPI000C7F3E8D|nr:DNA-3-methyladenine glycosylase [Burkholderia sp. WAC0059]PLZ02708.1 DNA repair protein [Burkholderia sp. WAC0059]
MATATKAQTKRSASPTGAAAAKAARGRGAAKTAKAGKPAAPARKRGLNGANGSAGAPAASALKAKTTRTKAPRAKGNGAATAEAGTRADELRIVETLPVAEAAVPVQLGGVEPEMLRPAYWDRACADLVKRDRILKKLIPKFGPVHLLSRGDPFVTLARSVVGQQISVAAAQAVWQRVELTCPKLLPQQFLKLGHEKLMACGLSKRKTEYILDLAQHFVSGALHVGKWTSMDDEDVIAELTQIRGIGRWTAEMFLIFNLSRPNVLPLDDLGLIRAISVNYFSGEPVTRSEAREVAANWEPWRTVATWYMWRSLEPAQA